LEEVCKKLTPACKLHSAKKNPKETMKTRTTHRVQLRLSSGRCGSALLTGLQPLTFARGRLRRYALLLRVGHWWRVAAADLHHGWRALGLDASARASCFSPHEL
jgi:hypothetical protein